MDRRLAAGIQVVEAVRNGRSYTYPADYPNRTRIEASIALSATHDDGDIVALPVDPERYPAQDAYFSSGTAQSGEFVEAMARTIDPSFSEVLDRALLDDATVGALHRIGRHLSGGGTVINAVPHGPLLDIGLLHAATCLGLGRLGYSPQVGIVISHGIAGRGRRFGADLVCLADALDWACDKVWYVTPRTSRTDESHYAAMVGSDRIGEHNAVVRADVLATQQAGGWVITVAPSATSDRRDAAGVHWVQPPTRGTLRMLAHPNTLVALACGRFLGVAESSYRLDPNLIRLSDGPNLAAEGGSLMRRMAAGMSALAPGGDYRVRDPLPTGGG